MVHQQTTDMRQCYLVYREAVSAAYEVFPAASETVRAWLGGSPSHPWTEQAVERARRAIKGEREPAEIRQSYTQAHAAATACREQGIRWAAAMRACLAHYSTRCTRNTSRAFSRGEKACYGLTPQAGNGQGGGSGNGTHPQAWDRPPWMRLNTDCPCPLCTFAFYQRADNKGSRLCEWRTSWRLCQTCGQRDDDGSAFKTCN